MAAPLLQVQHQLRQFTALTSRPAESWLISAFWQKTQRKLQRAKKIVRAAHPLSAFFTQVGSVTAHLCQDAGLTDPQLPVKRFTPQRSGQTSQDAGARELS